MSYLGHTLLENRHGLIVDARVSLVDGYGERETELAMLADIPRNRRKTVRADKNYDTRGFVETCRGMKITPHVARNDNHRGGSAIDGRTSRHDAYTVSQRVRKRIEVGFAGARR